MNKQHQSEVLSNSKSIEDTFVLDHFARKQFKFNALLYFNFLRRRFGNLNILFLYRLLPDLFW
jgi:hypothetical protein